MTRLHVCLAAFVVLLVVTPQTVEPANTFTQIDFPGAAETAARGINPRGDIVGSFEDAGGGVHGFLLSKNGAFSTIDFPGSPNTVANGINPSGDIVGFYLDPAGPPAGPGAIFHGFLLSENGAFSTIDAPGATRPLPVASTPVETSSVATLMPAESMAFC